ncbi:MAG: GatB/YqeY domain-containing protein [Myxococcales bacterium]|nr:GatB/YqeY domain-containing protein [Myxococcales bacterium]
MREALKAGEVVRKSILKVALGEIQTAEARAQSDMSDEEAQKVLKKLVKSIDESLEVIRDDRRDTLLQERDILQSLLPRGLSIDELQEALLPVAPAIVSARGEGPATGVAMKHLRAQGLSAEGKDVAAAVERIRAAGA